MSLYGYDRPTTPFINEWAKKTSVFNRVEAEGNWTATTVPSLMTGKRVWTHRVFNPHGSWVVKGSTENFPLLMKDNGYYTAAYNANSFASPKNLGLFNSFDNYYPHSFFGKKKDFFGIIDNTLHELFAGKIKLYNWFTQSDFIFKKFIVRYIFAFAPIKKEGKSTTTVPTDIAYNQFLQDLDKLPEPFFVWIHHYPPHDPYLPPEPYMGMFDASLELRTDESQENVVNEAIKNIHEGYQNRSDEFQQNINRLRARYDEFIRYCDNGFQDFISKFELKNKINKTVIIISADHGESFDHFNVKHGGTNLFESVTNIPLIIKKPDQSKGQLINNLTEQIDIPATILSLASIPVPAWMEGRSLTPLLDGKSLSSKPAISMSTYKNNNRGPITNGVFAVWEDDYKLILTLGDTDSKHSLLFNLKQDPDEMHNLFDKKTEIGLHLLNFINREFTKSNERNRKGKQL
jgi:arylsulfatase A-like enzyme